MTTSYNKYYDTYIKQKSTSGAIVNASKNYSLRNDGNSYLNGNVDITGTLNSISLTNLSNIQYLDISSSINTSISNLNLLLTGASFDSVYLYLNLSNNVHIYGKLQLGSLTDLEGSINTINTTLSSLTSNTSDMYFDSTYSYTNFYNNVHIYGTLELGSINNIESAINAINTTLSGKQNSLSNSAFLDFTSSGQTQINSINTTLSGKTTLALVQSNNNAFTGTNSFNSSLPTSTLTPTLSTQLITKAYADANYTASGGTTLSAIQSNNNVFTGTNSFNSNLPTSTITPTLAAQLITKTYADTQLALKNPLITASIDVYGNNISGASINVRTYLNVNGVNIPAATVSNLQYLDISSSLTTLLAAKTTLAAVQAASYEWTGSQIYDQIPTILSTTNIVSNYTNNNMVTTKLYVDTQDATKQNTITSSTTLSCGSLTCTSGQVNGELLATGNIKASGFVQNQNNLFSWCNIIV